MGRKDWQSVQFVGLTAVFVGYLAVWLPGPAAGLSFMGVEMGEWIKFLGVGQSRNLFYLPPITLGLLLALLTVGWPNWRWQTWAMRVVAVAVSLLAFPAIEAILGEPGREWLLRLLLIGLVGGVAMGVSLVKRNGQLLSAVWLLMALVGIVGFMLPTWFYFQIRPMVETVIGHRVGVGIGVWLNGVGHLLVTAVAGWQWQQRAK